MCLFDGAVEWLCKEALKCARDGALLAALHGIKQNNENGITVIAE